MQAWSCNAMRSAKVMLCRNGNAGCDSVWSGNAGSEVIDWDRRGVERADMVRNSRRGIESRVQVVSV